MTIYTERLTVNTKGFTDIINLTDKIKEITSKKQLENAQVLVYVPGSTASITNIEYEPGLIKDLPEALEKLAPVKKKYHHDDAWQDGNGYAHVRAALIGNSETYPIFKSELVLGTWQQIVLIDFDNKPRTRSIIVQITY